MYLEYKEAVLPTVLQHTHTRYPSPAVVVICPHTRTDADLPLSPTYVQLLLMLQRGVWSITSHGGPGRFFPVEVNKVRAILGTGSLTLS